MSSRTRNCSFELDSRGFVRATIDRGASVDVNDAREATRAAWSVAGEERRPILVDMRGIVSKTREARQHFASADAARMHVAVALLVASPLSRVIVNLFLGLMDQPVPTRQFTREEEAIDWLLGNHHG